MMWTWCQSLGLIGGLGGMRKSQMMLIVAPGWEWGVDKDIDGSLA